MMGPSIPAPARVDIYLSKEELIDLRQDLAYGNEFFSSELRVSNAAVVGLRVHRSEDAKKENTSLSYFSLQHPLQK